MHLGLASWKHPGPSRDPCRVRNKYETDLLDLRGRRHDTQKQSGGVYKISCPPQRFTFIMMAFFINSAEPLEKVRVIEGRYDRAVETLQNLNPCPLFELLH